MEESVCWLNILLKLATLEIFFNSPEQEGSDG